LEPPDSHPESGKNGLFESMRNGHCRRESWAWVRTEPIKVPIGATLSGVTS
jgi:hypothetical protein